MPTIKSSVYVIVSTGWATQKTATAHTRMEAAPGIVPGAAVHITSWPERRR